jgi:translation initiation factor IF-1
LLLADKSTFARSVRKTPALSEWYPKSRLGERGGTPSTGENAELSGACPRQIFSGIKEEVLRLRAKGVQVFQRHQYRIELENCHNVFGTLCGRMIKNRIWLNAEDACEVEISV